MSKKKHLQAELADAARANYEYAREAVVEAKLTPEQRLAVANLCERLIKRVEAANPGRHGTAENARFACDVVELIRQEFV